MYLCVVVSVCVCVLGFLSMDILSTKICVLLAKSGHFWEVGAILLLSIKSKDGLMVET